MPRTHDREKERKEGRIAVVVGGDPHRGGGRMGRVNWSREGVGGFRERG